MSELQEGWTLATITEVTQSIPNINPEHHPDEEFGYVDISSIDNSNYSIMEVKKIKGVDAPSRAKRPIQPGDVLFSNVRTYLRNIAIVPDDSDAEVCSTGFTVLRSNGAVDSRYLFRWVLTEEFIERVTPQQTGTHYPATSDRIVKSEAIPVPPINEQRRIVAKLEKLLSRVDAAQARLATIPRILKRFRQSVLSAACSGLLTGDWRDQNEVNQEYWEESKLIDLLVEQLSNGRSVVDATEGFPVLRLTCLKNGRIDLRERKIGAWTSDAAKKFHVWEGDFFVSRGNGSLTHVGRGGLVEEKPDPVAFPDTLIRVRVRKNLMDPRFLREVWRSSRVRQQIESAAHTSAGIWKISQKDIEGFILPVPSLAEQQEIVRRVEALFKTADALEARYHTAKAYVDKLTQSILAKAFRGELVSQDPNDEPASVLLEQLTRERKATNGKPNGQKGGKRTRSLG